MEDTPPPGAAISSSSRASQMPSFSLPVPGAPSSNLAVYKARIRAAFVGANPQVCTAFWLFGCINNVLYVIILSAALDLVGPDLPKAIVLLADVGPSFVTKLTSPYYIHLFPYRIRIPVLVMLAFIGMQFVAWAESLPMRLFGVILASISSGGGELSFMGLTHFYGRFAVPFYSSGTGAAGLLGAGLYVLATGWAGWGVRESLMVFGFLPVVMLFAFFAVLPLDVLKGQKWDGYEPIAERTEEDEEEAQVAQETEDAEAALLATSVHSASGLVFSAVNSPGKEKGFLGHIISAWHDFRGNLRKTQHLFFPYMLPLLLVYISEYTINQGVAPTLLFPIAEMPFKAYRDAYPMYNTMYQTGVFISRSSTPFIRIRNLYPPSLLQCVNLAILVLHAMYDFIPNVWLVLLIVFWEGLLGGLVYVNTFAEITDAVPVDEREFSLSAVTVSDSGGVCIAGFISLALEGWLCRYQVAKGRDYCKLI